MSVEKCRYVDIPRMTDDRGSLSFVEPPAIMGFEIRRVYYLYDIPAGKTRGAHGHRHLEQIIIAMAGSFDIVVDDGMATRNFTLSRPDQGLYICPMIWRDLRNFSPGSVCVVLASERYDEADYFRTYQDFIEVAKI